MIDEDDIGVDDLVTGKAAEQLGEGVIPTGAILVVETMSEAGVGLRYVKTAMPPWHAMGMVRSTLMALEAIDLQLWCDEDEDD